MENKCNDILKLGLLQRDMSSQKAHTGIREQIEWLEFPHKIFFDYVMAFHIEKQDEVSIENCFTSLQEAITSSARFKEVQRLRTPLSVFQFLGKIV